MECPLITAANHCCFHSTISSSPLPQEDTCLCNLVAEHNFKTCRFNEPFTLGPPPCYELRRATQRPLLTHMATVPTCRL